MFEIETCLCLFWLQYE